jgi:hypothetical protein
LSLWKVLGRWTEAERTKYHLKPEQTEVDRQVLFSREGAKKIKNNKRLGQKGK